MNGGASSVRMLSFVCFVAALVVSSISGLGAWEAQAATACGARNMQCFEVPEAADFSVGWLSGEGEHSDRPPAQDESKPPSTEANESGTTDENADISPAAPLVFGLLAAILMGVIALAGAISLANRVGVR